LTKRTFGLGEEMDKQSRERPGFDSWPTSLGAHVPTPLAARAAAGPGGPRTGRQHLLFVNTEKSLPFDFFVYTLAA
jgi:hypothetical protein